MAIKLDIGSGGPAAAYLGEGWLGVDPYVASADIQAPMWELPFEDNSVDAIFTSHALEHVGKNDVPRALREWRRVLKPGCRAIIQVPDLEWCVRHWLAHQGPYGAWSLDIIFGNQNHEGEYHKTGFTELTLFSLLRQAGFLPLSIERISTHSQMTLKATAEKPG
jgi:SAM-dependent methyltransferase